METLRVEDFVLDVRFGAGAERKEAVGSSGKVEDGRYGGQALNLEIR